MHSFQKLLSFQLLHLRQFHANWLVHISLFSCFYHPGSDLLYLAYVVYLLVSYSASICSTFKGLRYFLQAISSIVCFYSSDFMWNNNSLFFYTWMLEPFSCWFLCEEYILQLDKNLQMISDNYFLSLIWCSSEIDGIGIWIWSFIRKHHYIYIIYILPHLRGQVGLPCSKVPKVIEEEEQKILQEVTQMQKFFFRFRRKLVNTTASCNSLSSGYPCPYEGVLGGK